MNNLINSGEHAFKEFDSFFNTLTHEDVLYIDLLIIASEYCGMPELVISINEVEIESNFFAEGRHKIQVSWNTTDKKSADLRISMRGKKTTDTQVVDGKIVKDKCIIIEQLLINNFDVTADPDLFYNKLRYTTEHGKEESVKNGFWGNSTLHINIILPFSSWYQSNSTQNINLSETLVYRDDKHLAEQQYNKLVNLLDLLK